jgi:hypothetical protein
MNFDTVRLIAFRDQGVAALNREESCFRPKTSLKEFANSGLNRDRYIRECPFSSHRF